MASEISLHRAPGTCCPEPACDSLGEWFMKTYGRECDSCGAKCEECRRATA